MDGLNPITRKETFLAAAGGQDVTTPTPVTREEVFLDAIANGGGGSSGGGVLVVTETIQQVGDDEVRTLDKTYAEIVAAGYAVKKVDSDGETSFSALSYFGEYDGTYIVSFGTSNTEFVADSADGTLTHSGR